MLNGAGAGSHNSSLLWNAYGFFRARATNNSYFSTNGFGAVAGVLSPGNNLIGNLFGSQSITNIISNPPDGLQVYRWNPIGNSYTTYSYSFLGWHPSVPVVDYCEGIIIRNNTTMNFPYQITGILTTNTVQKTLYTNLNLIASQLYRITDTNTWRVDTLNTNRLGGLSGIPVQSGGFNPQATVFQATSTVPDYDEFNLSSSNKWELFGIQTNIHLHLTEGFWIQKPTNSVWSIQRWLW